VEISHRSRLFKSIPLNLRFHSFCNHSKHTAFGSRRPSGSLGCPQLTEGLISLFRNYLVRLSARASLVPIVHLDLFLNVS
jgi:hypothetical protein